MTKKVAREGLAREMGNRKRFRGVFERFGTKKGWAGEEATVLLKNIRDTDNHLVSDHLWFAKTQEFARIELQDGLRQGDVIEFDARVTRYQKGYLGGREDVYKPVGWDYRLSRPTRVTKIGRTEESDK